MEKGMKIGLGIGGAALAIAIVYFGFTEKGKQKWSNLMGSKGTDGSGNSIPRKNMAEDAGIISKISADGMTEIPKRAGMGSPFGSNGADGKTSLKQGLSYGSNVSLKEVKTNGGVVIGWVDKNGQKWEKA